MNPVIYWIWLQQALGYGSEKLRDVIDIFGSAEGFYKLTREEDKTYGSFSFSEMERIKLTGLDSAAIILDECTRLGYTVISYENNEYPYRLRMIQNPPAVLYVWGELPPVDSLLTLAMVGTRTATHHGYKVATLLSQRLSSAGAVIVSGCAQGIDTAAHQGCIEAGGRTIAVLGCGINHRYNMSNADLRRVISQRGAVISEYPPSAPALKHTFPQRNRIISGLSLGVIVAEAGVKSGSLITARLAAEQGRDLYAVPGNADSQYMFGVNALIRDGAAPVICALDILSNYVVEYAEQLNLKGAEVPLFAQAPAIQPPEVKQRSAPQTPPQAKESLKPSPPQHLSATAKQLYSVMEAEPVHIDELAERAGLEAPAALCALTELEINGSISAIAGRRYAIKNL
ncbi:MAG: DNA-processing protein DprA [Oscillospiraceae bacterium]|nr:DNA-processing protein DprA [Oscillospiraceae bacterium]